MGTNVLSELPSNSLFIGFPGGTSGKEPVCQYRRHKRDSFDPLVGKIPWRRAWQPNPIFLPGKCHGQKRRMRCRGVPSAHSHGMLVVEQKKNGVSHLCPKFWGPSLTSTPGQGNFGGR